MEYFIAFLLLGVLVLLLAHIRWDPKLDAMETRDTLAGVLQFMRDPEWESSARQLTWLVHQRLPDLIQKQEAIIDRVQPRTVAWPFMHGLRPRPWDERIEGIFRLVRNLHEEAHQLDGFEKPDLVRSRIAREFQRHQT